jgi:hypothetical protein
MMSKVIADELCRGRQRSELEIVKPGLQSWLMRTSSLSSPAGEEGATPVCSQLNNPGISTPLDEDATCSTLRMLASSVDGWPDDDGEDGEPCLTSVEDPLPPSSLLKFPLPDHE